METALRERILSHDLDDFVRRLTKHASAEVGRYATTARVRGEIVTPAARVAEDYAIDAVCKVIEGCEPGKPCRWEFDNGVPLYAFLKKLVSRMIGDDYRSPKSQTKYGQDLVDETSKWDAETKHFELLESARDNPQVLAVMGKLEEGCSWEEIKRDLGLTRPQLDKLRIFIREILEASIPAQSTTQVIPRSRS